MGHGSTLLRDFDVKFRLRRIFHLIYYVYQLLYGESRVTEAGQRTMYLQLLHVSTRRWSCTTS
jgi:hypothetical protein